jgi:CheY-like chemotaxis protein/anti-sigma regulatory factor (Ser/Thr protein kinase)
LSKVLVVDDAEIDRRLAGACVEELGAEPIYARDGDEALDLVVRQSPDVVLTDLQMPGIDGLALVEALRRNHGNLPVILMTAWGSEEIAVAALRAGAASYVPKKHLRQDLAPALEAVLEAVTASRERARLGRFLHQRESSFVMGNDRENRQVLASYLQEELAELDFCDEAGLTQIGMTLIEALANAMDHGNLELDSSLRESGSQAYWELAAERARRSPYKERRVFVNSRLTQSEVRFVVRDEGKGFDVSKLPDPTRAENLLKASGRGIMLIRTFMDEVSFNEAGNEITMVKRRADRSR